MKLRLNPSAPNGLSIEDKATEIVQLGSSSSGLSSVPDISYGTATPTDGVDTASHLYYDTDDSTLYVYVAGIWYPISGGGAPPTTYRMLLENGIDAILLENGDYIRTE